MFQHFAPFFSAVCRTGQSGRAGRVRLAALLLAFSIFEVVCPHFAQSQTPRLVIQQGHNLSVEAVALSPDGKLVASGGFDNNVHISHAATGRLLRILYGYSYSVESLAFHPDGKMLASGSSDGTIRLWRVRDGLLQRVLRGHKSMVQALAFAPDGKTLLSGSRDETLGVWDISSGKRLQTIAGQKQNIVSVALSSDGKLLASGGSRLQASRPKLPLLCLWDRASGKLIRRTGKVYNAANWGESIRYVGFATDGKTLYANADEWSVVSGRRLRATGGELLGRDGVSTLRWKDGPKAPQFWLTRGAKTICRFDLRGLDGPPDEASGFPSIYDFRPDVGLVAGGTPNGGVYVWETRSGRRIATADPKRQRGSEVAVSPVGTQLALGEWDGNIGLIDYAHDSRTRADAGHHGMEALAYSPNGKFLVAGGQNGEIKVWERESGQLVRTLSGTAQVNALAFAPSGDLACGDIEGVITIWNVETGEDKSHWQAHDMIGSLAFGPQAADGALLASGGYDKTAKVWNPASGKLLWTQRTPDVVTGVAFDGDAHLIVAEWSGRLTYNDIARPGQKPQVAAGVAGILRLTLSPDRKFLVSGGQGGPMKLWRTSHLAPLPAQFAPNDRAFAFLPDGKTGVSLNMDGTLRFWRLSLAEQPATPPTLLAILACQPDGAWSVIDAQGRYDTSESGSANWLHWVVGDEPIALEQLKERYYEPGLLLKALGYNRAPLRDVPKLAEIGLYPDIASAALAPGGASLNVALANRGGGIGKVKVFINDKEFVEDARAPGASDNAPKLALTISLAGAPIIPDAPNVVKIVAYNRDGYLASRPETLAWTPPDDLAPPDDGDPDPRLYALVGGVSEYDNPELNLRFSGTDAQAMAAAIELGAKRLFGTERVSLTLLATNPKNPAAVSPTRANFEKAFADIRRKARARDVVVIYLAGHGVSLQRNGTDLYCYLTRDARSKETASLSDPQIRAQSAITSQEIADWLKRTRAQKQALILDTCAAGAAAANLLGRRDVSGDQIRALEQVKDSTGLHALMGCAADSVSYEASSYGQGLLTYSLLQGMRGAGLRNLSFVDVDTLFLYAAEQVPTLAAGVGGIQRPHIAGSNTGNLEIGQITAEDRPRIPLAFVHPLILKPRLQNTDGFIDDLGLEALVRKSLLSENPAEAGPTSPLYVDADELPGALRPSGAYTITQEQVTVKMTLVRDRERVKTVEVTGAKSDLPALAARLTEALLAAAQKGG